MFSLEELHQEVVEDVVLCTVVSVHHKIQLLGEVYLAVEFPVRCKPVIRCAAPEAMKRLKD